MEAGSDSYYQNILSKRKRQTGGYNYDQNNLYQQEKKFFNGRCKEYSGHCQQSYSIC